MLRGALIRRLFAESGGRCSFLGCASSGTSPSGGPLVEIAHIESHAAGAPRFSPRLTEFETDDYDNVMLLCPQHHLLIDQDPDSYPASRLKEIRDAHLHWIAALLSGADPRRSQVNRFRQAVKTWESERDNGTESFWQKLFEKNPELLLPASGGRPFILKSQSYVGGRSMGGGGSNLPDFVAQCNGNVVLIEIKTPRTKLMGARYRGNAYSPSRELAGSCIQSLEYRASLMNNLHNLRFHSRTLSAHNPTAVIVIGDTERPALSEGQRRSFELFRHCLKDVTVLTYDELFGGVSDLAIMMEETRGD
jgi:hypothetical protein